MIKLFYIFVPFLLFASSPFDTQEPKKFDLYVFEKKKSIENKEAIENKKIKCRLVCDKKVYKEQKISEAIEFYKNSKDYFKESK
ncbi:hypothetical protein [Sulfurimonas sp.]|uniref:hypothetical protein n=1 Tax=Sulfurimonas sp. TaxID=2022749 RepID=UPI002AB2874E|nr:hypothetical protein [Sulfurimonas sp.]